MGQRLVITVKKNDKNIAKVYYHWSAYTLAGLCETQDLIMGIQADSDDVDEIRKSILNYVFGKGGTIDGYPNSNETKIIQEMFKDIEMQDGSRNEGLIAFSEEGMEELQSWSEGNSIIDLDKKEIEYSVFFTGNNEEKHKDKLQECKYDFDHIKFDQLVDVVRYFTTMEQENNFEFLCNNKVYCMIA